MFNRSVTVCSEVFVKVEADSTDNPTTKEFVDESVSAEVENHELIYQKLPRDHRSAKVKRANISRHSKTSVKRKTAEEVLHTEKRKMLAVKIQDQARQYKISFNRLIGVCDGDSSMRGPITLVQDAIECIEESRSFPVHLPSEAISAAEDLLMMESTMKDLEADGVSPICSAELSRRVLDEIDGQTQTRELTIPVDESEDDDESIV
mmetsp:Transcript_32417/g.46752  ORF Transcript_32417/g.46752 Transcript_32417/m.46752 type:complete len:206 (+) Transcript_32417:38-655(+)|eukprot:CAMPEP_0170062898 /NCGR_PEP_ID=MMETSP0019_2-20121128/3959_1 /TAXON_ID=98059 /ORGANISM="Dinobryon sp., Strain UTEXLB2267" /LENGTH=205 /DNA_ID=CAMNT_0010269175 /DNA_START=38 /DNA_END=655 /DNA_ORIENTATION=+